MSKSKKLYCIHGFEILGEALELEVKPTGTGFHIPISKRKFGVKDLAGKKVVVGLLK